MSTTQPPAGRATSSGEGAARVAHGALLREVPAAAAAGLRLTGDGDLQALTPAAYATPLGLHPDIRPSTFSVGAGDRLVFYTNGLLEARDRAGRYFRLEDCRDTLRRTDLQAAAGELLGRLLAHTGRSPGHDVAVLLFEPASPPTWPRDEPAAAPGPAGDTLPGGDPAAAAASGFPGRPAARKR